ncbi:class I histocompatibility antigen, F10 alpha chain-like [Pristis pectinata]|uniref:class I histocompatibility antigen, F10 alpha chain-like n=1 Tax=Pristis pectinata TaxID=685728 RepID=UPI00223D9DB5|nr:class I histocompatibility antigen, F10 alpha chain-like [Pristis pectinata]
MFMFILLVFFRVQVALAESHSLIYYYTMTHGTADLPEYIVVGVLDGYEIQYYDKNMEVTVPRQEWMAAAFDKSYWAGVTVTQSGFHGIIKGQVTEWLQQRNETANYHYLQGQFGCEVNDPSPNNGILKLAFDGRYAFSFDKDKLKWIVHDPIAQPFKEKWDNNVKMDHYFKSLLENDCVNLWRTYYAVGEAYLTRKVTPEVSLDARKRDRWFLYCNVSGFYPPAISVTWFRNGQRVSEMKSTGILPNVDGTYQLKSVLELDPFDGKVYSCHIDHSSLPDGKTVVWEGNSKEDRHIGLIAVCVLILLSVILGGIVFLRKRRKAYENIRANQNLRC